MLSGCTQSNRAENSSRKVSRSGRAATFFGSGTVSLQGATIELGNSIAGVVSRNVKAARISVGLSQKELARKSGLSIRYISRLVTKPQNIRIDNVALLASHMGIEPASLLVEGPSAAMGLTINVNQPRKHSR